MKPLIRVCINIIDKIIEIKNGRVIASVQDYHDFYIDSMFKHYNTSLIGNYFEGAIIPGSEASDGTFSYSGCLGSIQANQSDYILRFVSHPVIGRNLSIGGIYGGSSPIIVSAYDPQVKPIEMTILSSLSSPVPFNMKMLFLASLFVFFFIFVSFFSSKFFHKIKQNKISLIDSVLFSFDIIIGSLLKNYSCFEAKIESRKMRKSIRLVIFLVVIFTFLFMYSVCCLIKTEQVVIPEPETIRSYKKIVDLNGKTTPIFLKNQNYHLMFKYSSKKSTKNKLWNLILKQKGGLETSLIKYGQQMLETELKIINQTQVFLTSNLFKISWATDTCLLAKMAGKRENVLISVDPEESVNQLKSTIKRRIPLFEGNVQRYKKADSILNAFHEMGLNEKVLDLKAYSILRGKPVPKGLQDSLRECLSNVIIRPHPEISDKTFKQFASLFSYFIWSIISCLIILVIEVDYNNSLKNKAKK